jgi:hypothetical protein
MGWAAFWVIISQTHLVTLFGHPKRVLKRVSPDDERMTSG